MSGFRTIALIVWMVCLWTTVGTILGVAVGIEVQMAEWEVLLIAGVGGTSGFTYFYFLSK